MIGISPILIMVLIGSLIFFLVQVFYQGEYPQRLVWVLAMYVMGTVGLARISIEESSSRAAVFAVPLAFVVFIALSTFVQIEGATGPLSIAFNVTLMVQIQLTLITLPQRSAFTHALLAGVMAIAWWAAASIGRAIRSKA